ncbi:hypothetical protein QBC40DRAFT_327092, partial [Triangularia verruculosa]
SSAHLPIPNRERNEGGELEFVSHWYPQRPRSAAPSSWRGDRYDRRESFSEPKRPISQAAPRRKICGLNLSTFILSCAVVILFAGVGVVAALLGSKVANLEATVPSVMTQQARANSESAGNNLTQDTDEQPAMTTDTTPIAVQDTRMKKQISGWKYIGCFEDYGDRILMGDFKQQDDMTNSLCAEICDRHQYKYFGTEFYNQCMCGESVVKKVPASDWRCDKECCGNYAGEVFEPCGGEWFISLWERQ